MSNSFSETVLIKTDLIKKLENAVNKFANKSDTKNWFEMFYEFQPLLHEAINATKRYLEQKDVK